MFENIDFRHCAFSPTTLAFMFSNVNIETQRYMELMFRIRKVQFKGKLLDKTNKRTFILMKINYMYVRRLLSIHIPALTYSPEVGQGSSNVPDMQQGQVQQTTPLCWQGLGCMTRLQMRSLFLVNDPRKIFSIFPFVSKCSPPFLEDHTSPFHPNLKIRNKRLYTQLIVHFNLHTQVNSN